MLGADPGIELDGDRPGVRAQPRAVGLGDTDDGNLDVSGPPQRATHLVAVHVVGDDQPDGTAFGGGGLFGRELTAAAVDEHHSARHRQTVVVGSLTARGVFDLGRHERARHALGCGADGELQRLGCDRLAADGDLWILGERKPHLELRGVDVEALIAQGLDDVVDARVVPGSAQRPRAVVGVGDVLQRGQVPHHGVDRHPLPELTGKVHRRGRRLLRLRLGLQLGLGITAGQSRGQHDRTQDRPRHIASHWTHGSG